MADYEKMYYLICNAASKAIDAPPEKARQILQSALYEAENICSHLWGKRRKSRTSPAKITTAVGVITIFYY